MDKGQILIYKSDDGHSDISTRSTNIYNLTTINAIELQAKTESRKKRGKA
jgi:hypothetical protein